MYRSIRLIFPSMTMHFIMLFVDVVKKYARFYQLSSIRHSTGRLEITSVSKVETEIGPKSTWTPMTLTEKAPCVNIPAA